MSLLVFNDTHVGVQRSAGTTPNTAWQLRIRTLTELNALLEFAHDRDVLLLGDLFDAGIIPMHDVLATFTALSSKLKKPGRIWAVAGNHDLNKTSTTLSSFQFLCKLLSALYPSKFIPVFAPAEFPYGYIVPHLANQDLFDQALRAVPPGEIVYLHCNFDNNFAAQSDQSLNLSAQQAEALRAKQIIIAHEHQTRKIGNVWIPGNQIVTSISDCLNTDAKRFVVIDNDKPELRILYQIGDCFDQMDWTDLKESDKPFIRVTGTAVAVQAPDVVNAIASYRKDSNALVIGNAVKIATEDGQAIFEQSLESVKAFDIMVALRELFSAEEFAIIEGLQ